MSYWAHAVVVILGHLFYIAEGDQKPGADPSDLMCCSGVFISWNMGGWAILGMYLWLYIDEYEWISSVSVT